MSMNGKITLVSNHKDGKISYPTVARGTTLRDILYAALGADVDPDKYQVTVGGSVVTKMADCKLKDKDFVVISPKNVKGN